MWEEKAYRLGISGYLDKFVEDVLTSASPHTNTYTHEYMYVLFTCATYKDTTTKR